MGKARRDIELLEIVGTKPNRDPLAVGTRPGSDVDGDIEYFTFDHSHQLSLRPGRLSMQSTQYAVRRGGVVVLNELRVNAAVSVLLPVIGLDKEAAFVAVNIRLDEDDAVESCTSELQGRAPRCIRAPGKGQASK